MGPSELKRPRLLEKENRKHKQLMADLSLDKASDSSAIRRRMHNITQPRIYYCCEREVVMLRRKGRRNNHKRVHRINNNEGLYFLCGIASPAAARVAGNRST